MRIAKHEWVQSLRRLTGNDLDNIHYNELVGRWEFTLAGADGVPRPQFWGWYDQPTDPNTGMHPFRELDDNSIRVALTNLQETFVGNLGQGNLRSVLLRDMEKIRDAKQYDRRQRAEDYANVTVDALAHLNTPAVSMSPKGGERRHKGEVSPRIVVPAQGLRQPTGGTIIAEKRFGKGKQS